MRRNLEQRGEPAREDGLPFGGDARHAPRGAQRAGRPRAPDLRAGLAPVAWALLAAVHVACAAPAETAAQGGAALLFSGGSGSLTAAEQEDIHRLLGLELVAGPGGRLDISDVSCPHPTTVDVRFEDLDGDGSDEVFVAVENGCLFGNTGVATTVFIRDGEGRFRAHLGFPGFVDVLHDSRHLGFPDLLIGGPGFCFPVWRWDGEGYDFHRAEPQVPGGCP